MLCIAESIVQMTVPTPMTASFDPRQTRRREAGTEPLRRKRVQPVAVGSSPRSKVVNRLLLFLTVVLVLDALVGDKGLLERLRARRQYLSAYASLGALKNENAERRDYARRLREDPSAIEAIAREELGLIRPGELLFLIRDAKPQSH